MSVDGHYITFIFFLPAEALSRLDMVIRNPSAQHSDNMMAYDNAVSALGKICQFHRDSIDAPQVKFILLPHITFLDICGIKIPFQLSLFSVIVFIFTPFNLFWVLTSVMSVCAIMNTL